MSELSPDVSVVIPVFNSDSALQRTVQELVTFLEDATFTWELILVDDRSVDTSWSVMRELARTDQRIRLCRLLRNSGQHTALLAGLRMSTGEVVITMDDDGQHPPEEIPALLAELESDHDLVFGVPRVKQHATTRNLASRIVNFTTRHLFGRPRNIRVSSMKAMKRSLVSRISDHAISRPYINGEALLYSESPSSIEVSHRPSIQGTSRYSTRRALNLVGRIVLNYSLLPVRLVAGIGLTVATFGFALAVIVIVRNLVVGSAVAGWTSVVVLVSILQSVMIVSLVIVASYVMRTMERVENRPSHLVSEVVN